MKKDKITLVEQAVLRRATGYETTETVDEYVECEGEIRLVKRKVLTKNVPPDIAAAKMVIEGGDRSVTELTDEQLSAEKRRLLRKLKEVEKNGKQK